MTAQNIDWDLFCDNWDQTPVCYKDDPLSRSVAAWRRAVDTNYRVRWISLESAEPTDSDRALAHQIRQYYISKIAVCALRAERPLTSFQQNLYHMLETQQYQQGHIGMIYKLPYFYAEDQAHQELRESLTMVSALPITHNRESRQFIVKPLGVLTPQRKVLRSRRRQEIMEYWWADADRSPVLWPVGMTNPLRSLVEGLFVRGKVEINSGCRISSMGRGHDQWRFLTVVDPELA